MNWIGIFFKKNSFWINQTSSKRLKTGNLVLENKEIRKQFKVFSSTPDKDFGGGSVLDEEEFSSIVFYLKYF